MIAIASTSVCMRATLMMELNIISHINSDRERHSRETLIVNQLTTNDPYLVGFSIDKMMRASLLLFKDKFIIHNYPQIVVVHCNLHSNSLRHKLQFFVNRFHLIFFCFQADLILAFSSSFFAPSTLTALMFHVSSFAGGIVIIAVVNM